MAIRTWGTAIAVLGLAAVGYQLLGARREEDLAGRVVLITGGSRGLGLQLAHEFAHAGCRLVICARDDDELARARQAIEAGGHEVWALRCDVTDREEVTAMVEAVCRRFGGIDVLLNNAGNVQVGPVESMAIEDFESAMAANFWGAVHTTLAALPHMRRRRRGHVVNIDSIGGRVAVPHLLPYSCAKFALRGFSEGLRAELGREGLRVTTILPGLMRTGSPVNATFKGDRDLEYSWFAFADNLPIVTMEPEAAARRIVEAVRRGEGEVTLSWPAKALGVAHDLFPDLTMRMLSLADHLMPAADAPTRGARRGRDLPPPLLPGAIAERLDERARRFNQYPPGEASPVI